MSNPLCHSGGAQYQWNIGYLAYTLGLNQRRKNDTAKCSLSEQGVKSNGTKTYAKGRSEKDVIAGFRSGQHYGWFRKTS